jgi:hypothetical protein
MGKMGGRGCLESSRCYELSESTCHNAHPAIPLGTLLAKRRAGFYVGNYLQKNLLNTLRADALMEMNLNQSILLHIKWTISATTVRGLLLIPFWPATCDRCTSPPSLTHWFKTLKAARGTWVHAIGAILPRRFQSSTRRL